MRTLILFFGLFLGFTFMSFAQDTSYTIRRDIPIHSVRNPVNKTVSLDSSTSTSKATSSITHESFADFAKKITDTTYLDQIVGTYLKSSDRSENKISRKASSLFISIPGRDDQELIPQSSFYLVGKENPDFKVIIYLDTKNVITGINIQYKQENYAAIRKS